MESLPEMIFVGGCGRSGTTLVQKLLLRHPKISGGPELGLLLPISEVYRKAKRASDLGQLDHYIGTDDIKIEFHEFILSFFKRIDSSGVSYLSEKTPENLFAMDILRELFPQSKFIIVHRDGRAVLNSHLKVRDRYRKAKKYRGGLSPSTVIKLWKSSIRTQILLSKELAPEQLLILRYEALVTRPEKVIQEILEFLKLEKEVDLLSTSIEEQVKMERVAHVNDIWYTQEMIEQGVVSTNVDTWRKSLNPLLKFYAGVSMAKELEQLNYQNSSINKSFCSVFYLLRWKTWSEKMRGGFLWRMYIRLRFRS